MTTPDAQIRTSADLIVALGSTLATGMEKHEIDQCGPACQLLARLGVHAVRQAQSIGILVGRMDETVPAYFAEQAGQLVRGLVETWARAAWMMQPDSEAKQDVRALRIVKDSLVEMRKKLDYAADHSLGGAGEAREELERQEEAVAVEESKLGREVKLLPDTRHQCESCGRPDLYYVFARESDPAHASSISLATTVAVRQGTSQHLGGENLAIRRAMLLSVTLSVLEPIGRVILEGLNLDSTAWESDQGRVREELDRRLNPLM